jgi:hypothetical protein
VSDLATFLEFVPAIGAAGVLAAVLWLIVRGHIVTQGHLETERDARIREQQEHDNTRDQLRQTTKQLERAADAIALVSQSVGRISEIRRAIERIERKLDNHE